MRYIFLLFVSLICYYNVNAQVLSATGVVDTGILCFGQNTGQVTINTSGGTSPYTFLWDTIANSQTTQTASGLYAGTYAVTVADSVLDTVIVSITLSQPTKLNALISKTNISCYGINDGSILTATSGGTTAYSYLWNTGDSTFSLNNLTVGTYTVTITDQNSCDTILTATISQPAKLSPLTSTNNVTCFNGTNGSAFVQAFGGTTPYSFVWSSGSTTNSVANLSAGNYTVTVTDQNGCDSIVSAQIIEPNQFNVTVTSNNQSCFDIQDGSISIVSSGGTGNHSYAWSTSETTSSIANLSSGDYSVKIKDQNNCDTTLTISITKPADILLSVSNTGISCPGKTDGTGTATASGGQGVLSYLWNTGSSNSTVTGLASGTYTVTVSDENGCDTTNEFTIVNPVTFTLTQSSTDITCPGNNDGKAFVTVEGGTQPYSYQWSNAKQTASISSLQAGSYSVTITDMNSCDTTVTDMVVNEPEPLEISINPTPVICENLGSAIANVTGGHTPYTYAWSSGSNNKSAVGLPFGAYSVVVTDSTGCTITDKTAIFEQDCELSPAKVFTPNGDGINDTWQINNAQYYSNAEYNVYDRWGQLVHHKKGKYEPWDGKFLGVVLPFDTYFYVIFKDRKNHSLTPAKGSVTIIR